MPYEKSNKEIQNKRAVFKMKYQGDKSAFPFKFQSTIGGKPLKSGPAPEKKARKAKYAKDTKVGKVISNIAGSIFGGGDYKGEKSIGGQVKNMLTKGNKGSIKNPKPATIQAPNILGSGAGIGELSGKPKTSKLGAHVASTPTFKPTVKKDSWGTYRTRKGGGYEYQKKGDTKWTHAKSKKGAAAIGKLFGK